MATSTRASLLATGCTDGSAWLWELSSGRRLRELSPRSSSGELAPVVVRFSADAAVVAVGIKEQLTLWDIAAERPLGTVTLPRTPEPRGLQDIYQRLGIPVPKVAQPPSASANPGSAAASERSNWIRCLAVHPVDHLIAVGTNVDVSLWDVPGGRLVRRLGGTSSEIQQAKQWGRQARPHDLVVVFAAGHGMTDADSNYYFGTYDIDPAQPAAHGLPYESFEELLDGIPALQKVLLLDTCFSGEIDKDAGTAVPGAEASSAGTVTRRAFKRVRGVKVTAAEANDVAADQSAAQTAALPSAMLRFQQDWFADLRRGTGAAVISSSSGDEFSFEGEQWHNGVFTYVLLQGLKNGAAANKDHIVTVSELQAYVIDQVRKLTAGGQNPTVRRENLDYDFPSLLLKQVRSSVRAA